MTTQVLRARVVRCSENLLRKSRWFLLACEPLRSGPSRSALASFANSVRMFVDVKRAMRGSRVRRGALDLRSGDTIIVIEMQAPRLASDGGSDRLLALTTQFLALGQKVCFFTLSGMSDAARRELEQPGVFVFSSERELTDQVGDAQAVIACRPIVMERFAGLLAAIDGTIPVLYDTVDIHSDRMMQEATLANDIDLKRAARRVAITERLACTVADGVLVASDNDAETVRRWSPHVPVHIVPTTYEILDRQEALGRSGCLFVGNFGHGPNADALEWIVDELFPKVLALEPETLLRVVGQGARSIESPGITFVGNVPDVGPFMQQARVVIAPIRFGSGMKSKVASALCSGVPVVTTTIGAQGFSGRSVLAPVIADDAGTFATQVVRLLADDSLWLRASEASLDEARRVVSNDRMVEAAKAILATVEERLQS